MSESLTLRERFKLSRFITGEAATDLPIVLTHRRIFILPTQRGLGFVLLITILLLVAFVYNNNLAYLLVFLMASMFFVSILHSFRSIAEMVVYKGKNNSVFAGDKAGFNVVIKNLADFPRINLHIMTQEGALKQTDIAPASTATVTLYSETNHRGKHELGTVTVVSFFPLGFFKAWSPINLNASTLVYPKPANSNIPYPENFTSKNQQGRYSQGSDDFYDYRFYQAGDPVRHIHWKAYAKGHGLYSKKYRGDSSSEIMLDLTQTPGNNLEQQLSQLCRWILDAEKANLRFGLKLPGINYQPSSNANHTLKCLEALALF